MSSRETNLQGLSDTVLSLLAAAHRGRSAMLQDAAEGQDWPGHVILRAVHASGPVRSGDIAEQLHLDPSTVSRYVTTLVRDGLLERQADPHDGRASLLAPTDAGLSVIEDHYRHRAARFNQMLATWSDHDLATLERLLTRFVGDFAGAQQRWIAERSGTPFSAPTTPTTAPEGVTR